MSSSKTIVFLASLLAVTGSLRADEGEWTPDQPSGFPAARWEELRSRGVTLDAGQLWDGAGGGLMTAVVSLGGCTGAFVSPDGLFVTNHHCAFDAIQLASTPERNLLRDGFVAHGRGSEVPARGGASRIQVVKRIVDVTPRVTGPGTPFSRAKTDLERYAAVERATKEIVAECERTPDARCQVASFYEGLSFRLQEQTELKDVRIVYAPPRAVGDYGGEEDNFQWPRHTGDFTFLRAYVAPDGSPAANAPANVPFRPKAWLRVSAAGVAPGDAVMVMGYPGRTQRYLMASAVRNARDVLYPLRARTNADLIEILEKATKGDAGASLKVAARIKSLANSEKAAQGQVAGLVRNGVVERVEREEAALAAFLAKGPAGSQASPAAELETVLAADRKGQEQRFFLEDVERSPGYLGSALTAVRWATERAKPDLDRDAGFQDRDLDRAVSKEKDATRSLAPVPQRKALAYLIAGALASPGEPPASLAAAFGPRADAAAVEARLAELDAKTGLGDEALRVANLRSSLDALGASTDPYLRLALAVSKDLAAIRTRRKETAGAMLRLRPSYLGTLLAYRIFAGRPVYPDANGTLRVSFASVRGYKPRDGMYMEPRTTLRGILEKERGTSPFAAPAPLLEKARTRDFGRFADASLDSVPVCFLSDADTTGGNSGSPVVNGKGELVGLNFDRVFENIAGDFGWSPDVSRNVCVDVRYALWLAEKVDGARELLAELLGAGGAPPPPAR